MPTLDRAEPLYETFAGWHEDLTGADLLEDLPEAAQRYLSLIEQRTGVRLSSVSTGPKRNETITW